MLRNSIAVDDAGADDASRSRARRRAVRPSSSIDRRIVVAGDRSRPVHFAQEGVLQVGDLLEHHVLLLVARQFERHRQEDVVVRVRR